MIAARAQDIRYLDFITSTPNVAAATDPVMPRDHRPADMRKFLDAKV
jgi:hypothetical protein